MWYGAGTEFTRTPPIRFSRKPHSLLETFDILEILQRKSSIASKQRRSAISAANMDDTSIHSVTKAIGQQSASDKVIDITELLENILLFLPLRSLLIAKRVSTRFSDTITHSTKIQQALFLGPHPVVNDSSKYSSARGRAGQAKIPMKIRFSMTSSFTSTIALSNRTRGCAELFATRNW